MEDFDKKIISSSSRHLDFVGQLIPQKRKVLMIWAQQGILLSFWNTKLSIEVELLTCKLLGETS